MSVNKGMRLKLLDERTSKTKEMMLKHGELLWKIITKIGKSAASYITLAQDYTGVTQALQ